MWKPLAERSPGWRKTSAPDQRRATRLGFGTPGLLNMTNLQRSSETDEENRARRVTARVPAAAL